jgi:hypothetical protein
VKRLLIIVAVAFVAFALAVAVVGYLHRERPATTALTQATQHGDDSSVASLIARGEDVNARDANGYPPLAYAALAGDTQAVNALLDARADPNARDCSSNGWTPLIHAIHKDQNDAARTLVERGADVNARAGGCGESKVESGMTPLMFAAMYDDTEMVKFLLAHGADARATNGDNNALSYAVAGGSLGKLADIDRAAAHPCPVETLKELLKSAPDAQLNDGVLDRAVMYVAKKKCPEVARLLDDRKPAPQPPRAPQDGGRQTDQPDALPPVARN